MRKIFMVISLVVSLFGRNAIGQMQTPYNLYFINPVFVNPASAITNDGFTAYANYRHQWMGLKGSPEYIKFGGVCTIAPNMGFSMNASGFRNGMLTNNELNAAYTFRVLFAENHHLSMGLSYGMYRFGINSSDNPVEAGIDPAVNSDNFNQTFFKTGFGLRYKYKALQVDLAIPELYDQSKKTYFSSIYAFVSYDLALNENVWIIKPMMGYRSYYNSLSQVDFGAMGMWREKFWIFAGYRTQSGMVFSAGLNVNKLVFAYSFELPSAVMSNVSSGSNEICLSYSFGTKKATEIFPTNK